MNTEITGEEPSMPHFHHEGRSGMSIRQHFAMEAMKGLISFQGDYEPQRIAAKAVKFADALIAELNK